MPEQNEEPFDSIEILIGYMVRLALHGRPPEAAVREAANELPRLVPELFPADVDERDQHRIARQWAVWIWNQIPLPSNDYRPLPLPKPGRNDPCPCGSGQKYKQCCANLPSFEGAPELMSLLWERVLKPVKVAERVHLLRSGRIPLEVIGTLAQEELRTGRPKNTMAWLEPLFQEGLEHLGHHGGSLLDLLCDAYDHHYRTDRKKLALLEQAAHARERTLRAAAWQHLATIRMDQDDIKGAWAAFQEAQRAAPDDPSLAVLEVTLLGTLDEWERVRQRADFWLARLRRQHAPELGSVIEFLERVRTDPQRTLRAVEQDHDENGWLARLSGWLDQVEERPPAAYRLDPMEGEAAPDDPFRDGMVLVPRQKLAKIERHWHQVFPLGKPFSVQLLPFDDDAWFDPEPWLAFLEEHPEAADSFDVLDDIYTALLMLGEVDTPWLLQDLTSRLLQRAQALMQATHGKAAMCHVPWILTENRPALRLLSHAISAALDAGETDEARRLMEQILMLNPNDNHGWRSFLVNDYLRRGAARAALELCERFVDDMLAEIAYGRALALFLLGRRDEADAALKRAAEQLPKVLTALRRARMQKPAISAHGITFGGDDQAWIYRHEMRDVWLKIPGVQQWLGAK